VVTKLLSKSRTETLHDSIWLRLRPVPIEKSCFSVKKTVFIGRNYGKTGVDGWILSDLVHSWIFLIAMLADFAVKIVEIKLYNALS